MESPRDEWPRVECRCADGRLEVIVNDTTVNEAFDVHPKAGKILLQCEGSEIFFRRLEVRTIRGDE